ncbi:hypothetical protein TWF106_004767 [Orbilia oligospora]|uniref:CID domain-containing protein n=1 Tax=Orbilia oligospora TaxID=2813651 RepID=A0A6G1LW52_ORBOL|nr:hypothetical protein TWF788_000612 [Orbilia oligospora]KAF3198173.1 hypothetical protein TWF106_004767 [Orbilia oligospora]KAF3200756.1 hypothetical protein TWF679_000663 [Orbilia oligospora]KAF3217921.1 hypothetical protein TWF191_008338 [Orbilia oligospora]KAF3234993.1 hypothetical protein TWF192_001085 [Orbilia oligospora]
MSLSDETVYSKLNALNETQEGIVSIAQWVMFHRRHAKRFAQIWLQRLKEASAPRKLNLVYLVNEVVQQMKARKKEEFGVAFAPIMADACEVAYRGSSADIQGKLRRVIQVWRQRAIFDVDVLDGIDARLDDVDKGKSSTTARRGLGGGIGGTTPAELTRLAAAQSKLNNQLTHSTIALGSAGDEYKKWMEADAIPPPAVYVARLSQLIKTLDIAHAAVSDALSSRRELIKNLETLLETNKTALAGEESQLKGVEEKKSRTDDVKKDVENMLLSGMTDDKNGDTAMRSTTPDIEPPREMVEALTPPPATEDPSFQESGPFSFQQTSPTKTQAPVDLLSSMLQYGNYSKAPAAPKAADNPMAGMEGLDADVVAMLLKGANSSKGNGAPVHNQTLAMDDDDDEYHP